MSYEAWRISYQDSEQAARAAYNELEKLRKETTNSQTSKWIAYLPVRPPRLKRDWPGKTVRLKRSMRNSQIQVPEGAVGIIKSHHTTGSHISFDPCPHCGAAAQFSHVKPSDDFLEFIGLPPELDG